MARKKRRSSNVSDWFTPDAAIHSIVGLGIGLALGAYIPALNNVLIGFTLVVIALILDYFRN